MSLTETEARDEIFQKLIDAWPTATPLQWPNVELKDDKPASGSWGRVTYEPVNSDQSSLADSTGIRRYTRNGLMTIQIFTKIGEGLSAGETLGMIIRNAYEGTVTAGGAWFPSVLIQNIGDTGGWHQTNVIVEWEYDENR